LAIACRRNAKSGAALLAVPLVCTQMIFLVAGPIVAASLTPPSKVLEKVSSLERTRLGHALFENGKVSCMKKSGYKYVPRPFLGQPPSVPLDELGQIDQTKFRNRFGWGISTLSLEIPGQEPDMNLDITSTFTADELATYNKTARLCDHELFVSLFHLDRTVPLDRFLEESYIRIDKSAIVVREFSKWSNCVHKDGFPVFASLNDAPQWIASRLGGTYPLDKLKADELRLSASSARCEALHIVKRGIMRAEAEKKAAARFHRELADLEMILAEFQKLQATQR
jgi:hypothetical protein